MSIIQHPFEEIKPVQVNPNPMTREQFKAIRAELGLTAPSMARLLRCAERTVFAYESGRSLVPGCIGAFLDLLLVEPAALVAAFKMAGVRPRKITPCYQTKPIWTPADMRRD